MLKTVSQKQRRPLKIASQQLPDTGSRRTIENECPVNLQRQIIGGGTAVSCLLAAIGHSYRPILKKRRNPYRLEVVGGLMRRGETCRYWHHVCKRFFNPAVGSTLSTCPKIPISNSDDADRPKRVRSAILMMLIGPKGYILQF